MSDNEDADGDAAGVIENLALQLSEVELLQSMFPSTNEFCLDEAVCLTDIEDAINGQKNVEDLNTRIGFTLKLLIGETQIPLEVICQLAHEYPVIPPIVFLRAPTLSKRQHSQVTESLLNFMDTMSSGELYIGGIIDWLQENAVQYIKSDRIEEAKSSRKTTNMTEKLFSRMWVYSHHLYSKIKRRDLLYYANELNLTGFSMTGKPGLIVIEGYNSHVEEFWGRVRRWQWKRIVMKEKEDAEINDDNSIDSLRKFDKFCERSFEPRQTKGRGHHGDRGLLFSFLEEKGCAHIFPYFFGVEGRPAEPDSD